MKKHILNTLFLSLALTAVPSFAGLINVSKITITPSTLNTEGWLQVSEVVAIETITGNDLALSSAGATATGSSNWPGSNANFAIDGNGPSPFPNIFHSNENNGSSFLDIVLATPSELDAILLFGRTDCCSSRDIYNISLFDSNGSLLFSKNDLDATSASHSVTINLPHTTNIPSPTAIWLIGFGLIVLVRIQKKSLKISMLAV